MDFIIGLLSFVDLRSSGSDFPHGGWQMFNGGDCGDSGWDDGWGDGWCGYAHAHWPSPRASQPGQLRMFQFGALLDKVNLSFSNLL